MKKTTTVNLFSKPFAGAGSPHQAIINPDHVALGDLRVKDYFRVSGFDEGYNDPLVTLAYDLANSVAKLVTLLLPKEFGNILNPRMVVFEGAKYNPVRGRITWASNGASFYWDDAGGVAVDCGPGGEASIYGRFQKASGWVRPNENTPWWIDETLAKAQAEVEKKWGEKIKAIPPKQKEER